MIQVAKTVHDRLSEAIFIDAGMRRTSHRGTYWYVKEHIRIFDNALKPAGIVREMVTVISRGRIPQENTLDLARVIFRQCRVRLHDIAVARVCHENELPLGVRQKDLVQQESSDLQCCANIAEIQGPGIEGAARVSLIDEVHVVAGHLFWSRSQVMEVEVWDAARPIGVDIRHVHPLRERTSKGVQETFLGIVYLGNAQDIIDI